MLHHLASCIELCCNTVHYLATVTPSITLRHHASKYAVTPSITLQHLASRIKLCCDKSPNNPIIRVALPTIIDHQLLEMRGMPGLLRAEICFYNPGYWNTELYFCNIHFRSSRLPFCAWFCSEFSKAKRSFSRTRVTWYSDVLLEKH